MKNKSKLFLILGLAACSALFIIGCKKYKEGPMFNISSKAKRLVGTWQLEYLYINGEDSTSAAMEQFCGAGTLRMELDDESNKYGTWSFSSANTGCFTIGHIWKLIDNKKTLVLNRESEQDNNFRPVGPFMYYKDMGWRIKRLTDSELWLDVTYNGDYSWVHFKKIEQ